MLDKQRQYQIDQSTNQQYQYEGVGLTPQTRAGQRIVAVDNFKAAVVRNEVGGTRVILTWNEDDQPKNAQYRIGVYSQVNIIKWASSQNVLDSASLNKAKPLSAPIFSDQSPTEIFIPTTFYLPATITISTMTPGGTPSQVDFQSYVSVICSPLGAYRVNHAADATLPYDKSQVNLVDTTAALVTLTLPLISQVIDGFQHTVKMVAGANNIDVQGTGGELIDGAAVDTITTLYESRTYMADRSVPCWWVI